MVYIFPKTIQDKEIVIAIGSIMIGQFSLLLSELPRARERHEKSKLEMKTSFLLGIDMMTVSFLGDDFGNVVSVQKFGGKLTAICSKLRIPEGDIQKRVEQLTSATNKQEQVKAFGDLQDWLSGYLNSYDKSLYAMYDLTLMAFAMANLSKNDYPKKEESAETIQNRIQVSYDYLLKTKKHRSATIHIAKPIIQKIRDKDITNFGEYLVKHEQNIRNW